MARIFNFLRWQEDTTEQGQPETFYNNPNMRTTVPFQNLLRACLRPLASGSPHTVPPWDLDFSHDGDLEDSNHNQATV